jgi:hypothetical protein
LRHQLAVYKRTMNGPNFVRPTACFGSGWPGSGPTGGRPSPS